MDQNVLQTPAAQPTAGSAPALMYFVGARSELFGILLRGSLLQIPTFGFYRFWLITNVRRHLWSQTVIGDNAFEYTGRGRELLIGFLIAMAILTPIYLVYFLLGLELERLQAFASVPLFLVLYALSYYAAYRARRYRATRTIFRGVRFWMTGSGWAYLGRAALWDIGTVLTLGFAYPWRAAALERYKMRHTRYGSIEGSFVGTGWPLFKSVAWMWVLVLIAPVLLGFLIAANARGPTFILGILTALLILFFIPTLRGAELRWWLNGVRLGPVVPSSDLRIGSVIGCYFGTYFLMLLYLLALGAFVAAVTYSLGDVLREMGISNLPDASLGVRIVFFAALALFYLVLLLGIDIIRRLFLDRGIWALAVGSVTLANVESIETVAGSGAAASSGVGEGLLDALDFGGGF